MLCVNRANVKLHREISIRQNSNNQAVTPLPLGVGWLLHHQLVNFLQKLLVLEAHSRSGSGDVVNL
jgi:hypothetical protein